MQVDFGKAFTYIFDDPKWFDKIIIPILFGLIPIVGWDCCHWLRDARNP